MGPSALYPIQRTCVIQDSYIPNKRPHKYRWTTEGLRVLKARFKKNMTWTIYKGKVTKRDHALKNQSFEAPENSSAYNMDKHPIKRKYTICSRRLG
jgi:hypothetical protein